VLLAVGGAAIAVLVGTASAFTRAAVYEGHRHRQQNLMKAFQAIKDRIRDLDETRHLLYAALMACAAARSAELIATIVTAHAHDGLALDPMSPAGLESLSEKRAATGLMPCNCRMQTGPPA
jgi:hypothetical protein